MYSALFETERTYIRRYTLNDASECLHIYGDPDVMKDIGDGAAYSAEKTRDFLRRVIEKYDTYGYSFWAVVEKSTNRIIGHSGFFQVKELNLPEIGFTIERSKWRRGFAFETSLAMLKYGFDALGFSTVVAFAQMQNVASEAVMKKLGMTRWKEQTYKSPYCVCYRIDEPDFRNISATSCA